MVIPTKYQTKLLEKNNLSLHFVHLVMQKPGGFLYTAGQYISLVVGENVRRAYSLCSWADKGNRRDMGNMLKLELLVDTKAGGPGSKFVEKLQVGDQVEFWGPYGKFVIPESIHGIVWFLGTGSGVAPLKAQVERIREIGDTETIRKIRLIFGTRNEQDIVFFDQFINLARTYKPFCYHIALSQPSTEFNPQSLDSDPEAVWGEYWHKGYVTEIAQELLKKEKPDFVFLCGHPEMMKDAIKMFLQAGVLEDQILFEKFT